MYKCENETAFDFSESWLEGGELRDGCFLWKISRAIALKELSVNDRGAAAYIPEMRLVMEDFKLTGAILAGLEYLDMRDKQLRRDKDRKLYKSEYPAMMNRLFGESAAIVSVTLERTDKGIKGAAEMDFGADGGRRELYRISFSCASLTAEWEAFGENIAAKKLTLRERAAALKRELPAMIFAAGHKKTPPAAKIAAALAAAYALSPVDLVPDFIPVLGYLDDVLIVSGLLMLAVKLIPEEVMEECRQKAESLKIFPEKKWYYAFPVIIIWLIIAGIIIACLLKE